MRNWPRSAGSSLSGLLSLSPTVLMRGTMKQYRHITLAGLLASILLAGCSNLVSSFTQDFAADLSGAILDNPDLQMVRDGAPAYLILVDTLVARAPDDTYLLQQSARLHTAYAAAFVSDAARARLLHDKARDLALAAVCEALDDACDLPQRPYREFADWVAAQGEASVDVLYVLAVSWAGWIQAHSDDFNAVADLARVKALMLRITQLRPGHDDGGAFLYLGVLETLLPPAMGGKPELGREYFERAIDLSGQTNLMAKVMYAEQYARLVFDRSLHDRLLREVLAAPVRVPGLTLMNTVAQEQAQELLNSADEYF